MSNIKQTKKIRKKVEKALTYSLANFVDDLLNSENVYKKSLGFIISESIERHLPIDDLVVLIDTHIKKLYLLDKETENELYAIEKIIYSFYKTFEKISY